MKNTECLLYKEISVYSIGDSFYGEQPRKQLLCPNFPETSHALSLLHCDGAGNRGFLNLTSHFDRDHRRLFSKRACFESTPLQGTLVGLSLKLVLKF